MQPIAPSDRCLVDVSNIAHRCYYGIKLGGTEPTSEGVVLGMRAGIRAWLAHLGAKPQQAVLVFDGRDGTKSRKLIDPTYKQDRESRPLPVSVALADAYNESKTWGYERQMFDECEADDVIAGIVRHQNFNGLGAVILSNDKDLHQLLTPTIRIMQPDRKTWVNPPFDGEAFYTKWDFLPLHYPHYKALAGDQSDGIKGVDGIGDGYARKLIVAHGTIMVVYDNLHTLEPKLQKLLGCDGAYETAMRCLNLVTFKPPMGSAVFL